MPQVRWGRLRCGVYIGGYCGFAGWTVRVLVLLGEIQVAEDEALAQVCGCRIV